MRIYKQYRWLGCHEITADKMIQCFSPNEYWWMLNINSKHILNFFFGWKLKENTEVSATFGAYKRWFKQTWLKRKI